MIVTVNEGLVKIQESSVVGMCLCVLAHECDAICVKRHNKDIKTCLLPCDDIQLMSCCFSDLTFESFESFSLIFSLFCIFSLGLIFSPGLIYFHLCCPSLITDHREHFSPVFI